jgi:hypothetical protein
MTRSLEAVTRHFLQCSASQRGTNEHDTLLGLRLIGDENNMPLIPRTRRRREMTLVAGVRRRIQRLGPYQSMVLLAIPVAVVEPLKFVSLFVAGKGHWLTGTGMIVAAYAVSLLIVERLFRIVRPKLTTLAWFARLWASYVALRNRVVPWWSCSTEANETGRN